MGGIKGHQDHLFKLNARGTLTEKLEALHQALRVRHPFVDRIALALYDPHAKTLRTFLHSSGGESPLLHYEASLENAPSLMAILEDGRPRVLNDLTVLDAGLHAHTLALRNQGYRSSYTLPFHENGVFEAFIFFNSYQPHVFTGDSLVDMDLYGRLAGLLVLREIQTLRTLLAALRTATQMVHLRDPETGSHLERMAHYTRLIARDISRRGIHPLDDDLIDHFFTFAPLHDLGKISVPDDVLLKPGSLDGEERTIMKTHALRGRQILDAILENFGLDGLAYSEALKAVAESHHEMLDGSGYPHGLKGESVPLVARIVAVADIFDALTTKRPYKEPWTIPDSLQYLEGLAGEKLDRSCVEALRRNLLEVEQIRKTFPEKTPVGA